MAVTTLKVVAGNTAPPQVITCERDNGDGTLTAINLTGCTVTLKIVRGNTVTQAAGSCVLTTPVSGIITYSPLTTDYPTAGSYKGDVKITYGDGTIEILYQQLKVKARAAL